MLNLPEFCESCGSKLEWSETGVDLLCKNVQCPAQILYKIEYFLKTLGAEELSATTLEKFELNSIEDLFSKLTFDYIKSIDGFQNKRAKTITEQIKSSITNVETHKLLASLGIPGLGLKNAEKIINFIDLNGVEAFEELYTIDRIRLLSINGIGNKLVDVIYENMEYIQKTVNMLIEYGLTFKERDKKESILNGLNITVTGSAPGYTRPQLEKLIAMYGGNNVGISKKTNLLLAENVNGNSSKLKKARELNIKIMTYEDFFENVLKI